MMRRNADELLDEVHVLAAERVILRESAHAAATEAAHARRGRLTDHELALAIGALSMLAGEPEPPGVDDDIRRKAAKLRGDLIAAAATRRPVSA